MRRSGFFSLLKTATTIWFLLALKKPLLFAPLALFALSLLSRPEFEAIFSLCRSAPCKNLMFYNINLGSKYLEVKIKVSNFADVFGRRASQEGRTARTGRCRVARLLKPVKNTTKICTVEKLDVTLHPLSGTRLSPNNPRREH